MSKTNFFIQSAIDLLDRADYLNSASRAYYAVYHVMRDKLEMEGVKSKLSHKAVHNSYGDIVCKTSSDRSALLSELQRWQRVREDVDYSRGVDTSLRYEKQLIKGINDMVSFAQQNSSGGVVRPKSMNIF